MAECIIACLVLSLLCLSGTIVFIILPIVPGEMKLWNFLRIQKLRHWITKRRTVNEPLKEGKTVDRVRRNLLWHLILTFVFITEITISLYPMNIWLSPFALFFTASSLAYLLGSIVQRQKIAIIENRNNRLIPRSPMNHQG
jgi:hypothetical protein